MLSRLTVEKSRRRYNDRNRVLPGAIVIYKKRRYVKRNQLTNGQYLILFGREDEHTPVKDCKIIPKTGLSFLTRTGNTSSMSIEVIAKEC